MPERTAPPTTAAATAPADSAAVDAQPPSSLRSWAMLPPGLSTARGGYALALGITAVCTAIAFPFYPRFDGVNVVMLYLLGTALGSLRLGRGPAVALAVANILAFDYFFVPPRFSFDVEDTQYIFTLVVMLVVAVIIADLVLRIRQHRDLADARAKRTSVLYAMSRELSTASGAEAMAGAAVRHIYSVFHCSTAVLLVDDEAGLSPLVPTAESADEAKLCLRHYDLELAGRVVARGERCMREAIYLPLQGSRRVRGVMVVRPHTSDGTLPAEQLDLLNAFAAQLALSLQRARLAQAAEAAKIAAERALLRNTLLASISHDLRTPLSAIAGAGSLIAQPGYALNADRRMTLGLLIERKARDMAHLLSNVLELAQMESGKDSLRTDWHAVDDLVADALRSNEARLAQWRIDVEVPADAPLILVEATLIVQILANLLENAAKYTPPGTQITIKADFPRDGVLLVVADDGPGFPPGDSERLFEKFQRGRAESNVVGVGLGLAICRAAARLHGGDIHAVRNPGGGARFEVRLAVPTQRESAPLDAELDRSPA